MQFIAVVVAALVATACAQPPGGIIRRSGINFVDDECKEYNPRGWNSWPNPVLLTAMDAVAGNAEAAAKIDDMFAKGQEAGFNTFRIFAHGVDGAGFQLQPEPGVYNETVFQGIDWILDSAGRHNIRAIISPATNWEVIDSKGTYVKWAGLDNADQFWTDETAKSLFKAHLETMANRVNTVNGRTYKEDPNIFSWNLFNEPRCPEDFRSPAGCTITLKSWITDVAGHLRAVDPNHMISLGAEGHFASGSGSEAAGPYGTTSAGNLLPTSQFWGAYAGQDPFAQGSDPNIDFLTTHLWPDGWRTEDFSWATGFLAAQQLVASRLNKPLLMEEFGMTADNRSMIPEQKDPWYRFVLDAVLAAHETNSPLQGALFWSWAPEEISTATISDSAGATINTYIGDSTWDEVLRFSNELEAQSGDLVEGCTPTTSLNVATEPTPDMLPNATETTPTPSPPDLPPNATETPTPDTLSVTTDPTEIPIGGAGQAPSSPLETVTLTPEEIQARVGAGVTTPTPA